MTAVAAISQQIWDMKYRLKMLDGPPVDKTVGDTWARVAKAACRSGGQPCRMDRPIRRSAGRFPVPPRRPHPRRRRHRPYRHPVQLLRHGRRSPTTWAASSPTCKEAALTMQQGGGIGYDFSTLRPKGAPVLGVGADASGPVVLHGRVGRHVPHHHERRASRRGAMMATLRCDHPDIEAFIDAKREAGRLRMFNLSVLVTDAFMTACVKDDAWPLSSAARFKTVPARDLWDRIMRATYAYAEPGVIFIDRINRRTISGMREDSRDQSMRRAAAAPLWRLPARLDQSGGTGTRSVHRACAIGHGPAGEAGSDRRPHDGQCRRCVALSAAEQQAEAKTKRRIGLGVTGLADALILCRARYGSEQAVSLTEQWLAAISAGTPIVASTELAAEKGPLSRCSMREKFLGGANVQDAGRGCARRHRQPRHPQRASDLHSAHRHDLAVRRQYLVAVSSRYSPTAMTARC